MKNIFYYDHRGTLEESLKTKYVFNSFFELFSYLKYLYYPLCTLSDINIHYYGFDDRINCYTFVVCIKNDAIGWLREEVHNE